MAIRTVCVCGSRDWVDGSPIRMALVQAKEDGALLLVHGAARGADSMAGEIGALMGYTVVAFPADWKKHGKAAGPIRNRQMLEEGHPDRVYAFPLGASRGTRDMIRKSLAAGVEVFEWDPGIGHMWIRHN